MSLTSAPTQPPEATMVVIGGFFNGTYSSSVDAYSIDNGTVQWKQKGANAPGGWHYAGIAVVGSDIYIAGGYAEHKGTNHVVAKYDTVDDSWSELPDMMHRRGDRPAVYVLNGALYAAGGTKQTLSVEYVDIKVSGAQWRESSVKLPHHSWNSVAVVVKSDVYISAYHASPTLLRWSVGDSSWTSLAENTVAKGDHCMVTDGDNYIWTIGGGLIEQYDISLGTRLTLTTGPTGVSQNGYICVYWDDYIVIRDDGPDGIFHAYHVSENYWKTSHVPESNRLVSPMVALINKTEQHLY